jgi:hypothetical protein
MLGYSNGLVWMDVKHRPKIRPWLYPTAQAWGHCCTNRGAAASDSGWTLYQRLASRGIVCIRWGAACTEARSVAAWRLHASRRVSVPLFLSRLILLVQLVILPLMLCPKTLELIIFRIKLFCRKLPVRVHCVLFKLPSDPYDLFMSQLVRLFQFILKTLQVLQRRRAL